MTMLDGRPVGKTRRERLAESIAVLENIIASASEDLAVMPSHKTGSDWEADRRSDIKFARRSLVRLQNDLALLSD